jgi:ssDNA-binding Zn-finger/Zn-ribbon topoisomerase 1
MMLNIISLELKCPRCGKELNDESKLIDNVPSVKTLIQMGEKEGTLWLSSVYGSYNLESTIEILPEEVAVFKCPHCKQELTSGEICSECSAPMVDFHLLEGGKVSICSRAGCKKHSIEFEDISTAINHFYNEFDMQKFTPYQAVEAEHLTTQTDGQEKEVIESGTFLNTYCPHCRMNLISGGLIVLKIEKEDGEKGILYLTPYLNEFKHATTIPLPEQTPVKDVKCIFCDHSLVVPGEKCPKCGSGIAQVHVSALKKLIDFQICTRKGCTWHGISDQDLSYVILEDSREW